MLLPCQAELLYITAHTDVKKPSENKIPPVPWLDVLRSRAVWAIQGAMLSFLWVQFSMMTLTPTYLDSIQNVSIDLVSNKYRVSHLLVDLAVLY